MQVQPECLVLLVTKQFTVYNYQACRGFIVGSYIVNLSIHSVIKPQRRNRGRFILCERVIYPINNSRGVQILVFYFASLTLSPTRGRLGLNRLRGPTLA